MLIRVDDLTNEQVLDLLREHLRCMALASPPEDIHAINLDGLRQPDVTFGRFGMAIKLGIATTHCGQR
jgi:putative acetyltransferase